MHPDSARETADDARNGCAKMALPCDIAAGEANAVRDRLRGELEACGAVALSLAGDAPLSPCALQLAISVKLSAEARGCAVQIDERLAKIFERVDFTATAGGSA